MCGECRGRDIYRPEGVYDDPVEGLGGGEV